MTKRNFDMASKQKENELILTPDKPKRTRTVIKWQPAFERVTCEIMALFMDNRGMDVKKMAMIGRKIQFVLESCAQTVKDGKTAPEMPERLDNLQLALEAGDITNSAILEALDAFTALFREVRHES